MLFLSNIICYFIVLYYMVLSAIGVYAGLHPFASLAASVPLVCVLTAHPAKVSTVCMYCMCCTVRHTM